MGYMKNKDKLELIKADESIAFAIKFLESILNNGNTVAGMMLYEILRLFCNLSEFKQDTLVKAGILPHLSRIIHGKLIERLHMKPAQNNDEYCSLEKSLAAKCLYPYAIHTEHAKKLFADNSLLQGIRIYSI